MPFFRMLRREIFGDPPPVGEVADVAEDDPTYPMLEEERIGKLVALTQHLYGEIERELKLTGFWESAPARNKLIADLQSTLLHPDFNRLPGIVAKRKQIISRLMEIAETNQDLIRYAI